MGLVSSFRSALSRAIQSFKRPKQYRRLKQFISSERQLLSEVLKGQEHPEKKGTMVIKCDDIGDFLIWRQVIPGISAHAKRPLYFVGNKVNQSLIETYFDFADHYIWIDKAQWNDVSYRSSIYKQLHSAGVKLAFTPLFTRNFRMDDMLLLSTAAPERLAWDISHHAYYAGMAREMEGFTTKTITSPSRIELEYFRNIEFINKVYPADMPRQFKPLFPNFGKQNRLVVVPVASAVSKCWKPEYFAEVIDKVMPLFDSVILLGGKDGIKTCREIETTCNNSKLMNLCGESSLNEIIPFIGESSLLLSPDTFALHAAMLTATDTVLLTNGTNWQRFSDYVPYISSRLEIVYPPDFKPDPEKVKLYYSRSEINEIKPETVIRAIQSMKKS